MRPIVNPPQSRRSIPGRSAVNRDVSKGCILPGGLKRSLLRLLAAGLAMVAGCSERSGILTGGASAGQMKTTISHLQFENEQLKTEVARLKEDNRSFEDRLVQEQVHNGDLAARLDDARNLLRDRGIDADTRLGAGPGGKRAFVPDGDEGTGPRTIPAGRSGRKPRKPPAASLPGGDLDELPKAPEDDPPDNHTISLKDADSVPRRPGFVDDPPHPADVDGDQLRWQPVATGNDPRATPRR